MHTKTDRSPSRTASHRARGAVRFVTLAISAAYFVPVVAAAETPADSAQGLAEIVVTATRRAENLQDVPISISAFNQDQMDDRGVRSIDDVVRFAPGVQFSRGGGFGSDLNTSISIRGIASAAGSATTGIYVDDTPIQVGSIIASGNFADNAYPQLFDVERVEVLRGPQGTLFGSGSEGGTVRFVTPAPSLSQSSAYIRGEAGYTQYGAPSYEVGAAGGVPLVENVLGLRASVWTRTDGGYIDKTSWYTGDVVTPNANWRQSTSARIAFAWKPIDGLTVTPSIFFQRIKANESNAFYLHSDGVPGFTNTLGNVNDGNYVDLHNVHQWGDQRLSLPALKVEYDWSKMQLVSNTSYYERKQSGVTDFQSLEVAFWAGQVFPSNPLHLTPGYDQQKDYYFTQELRLQSTDKDSPLSWVAGVFYSHDIAKADRSVYDPYLGQLILEGPFGQQGLGLCSVAADCVPAIFGVPQLGPYSFVGNVTAVDTQKAVFGQVDYKFAGHFIATVGLRYSKLSNNWSNAVDGPVNGVTAPAVQYGSQSANATTPKFMLSYNNDAGLLVYASATKGFRNGGSNAPVGANAACVPDLQRLGLTAAPTSYAPDSVWSYELGTKFVSQNKRLQINASLFEIDWDNQIRNVSLPGCTLSFTTNLGKARSRGGDLSVEWRALDALTLGANAGYQSVKATQTLLANPTTGPNGGPLYYSVNGQSLPGSQLSAAAFLQWNFGALGKPAYLRVDDNFTGKQSGISSQGISLDPNVAGWTATAAEFRDPSVNLANLRLGVNLDAWNVSLFVNNVFNTQPLLGKTRGTVTLFGVPTGEITATTVRPRTVGVTGVYKF